ncbi:LysR family transcriptional regulator [Candidatus Allofournierella merdipullorum]|uniref:LysR family transcriptional regulator n=1 Tax=Candidatus Allofournierella merdipullorum TaxID=2838595 RepID=UPI00374E3D70
MTIRHINIFLAVCEAGQNTTKAAEQLHMSQPAVSLAIRELEEYYGVALFDRIGRRLCITEAGKRFWEYASHISTMFDDMEKTLRDWEHLGVLQVGASITVGSRFLPGYVKTFLSQHPGLEIRAQIASTEVLTGKLMANELDFALVEGVPRHPSLVSEDYMEDHLAVICPAGGPFQQGETITVEQFRAQRFLLREKGSGTREEFDRVTEQAGFSVSPAWEAMSTTALVNAVIEGLGVSVLPQRLIVGAVERGLVVSVNVEGLDFRRQFRIIYHKDKFLPAVAREFLAHCRDFEQNYPLPRYNGLY